MQGQKVQFWKCLAQQNLFIVATVQLDTAIHAIYTVSKVLGREKRRKKETKKKEQILNSYVEQGDPAETQQRTKM